MLKGNNVELKFELLKIILSNPANKISEIDAEDIAKKLSLFVKEVWNKEPQQEAKL